MDNKINSPLEAQVLPREFNQHYISASEEDIKAMLKAIEEETLESLFKRLVQASSLGPRR